MEVDKTHKIMSEPLPQMFDELEDYIRRVDEAVSKTEKAAVVAEVHAEEAKLAGERAAQAAAQVGTRAEEAGRESAKVAKETAEEGIEKFRKLQAEHDQLKRDVMKLALAVNKQNVGANEIFLNNAPYLRDT